MASSKIPVFIITGFLGAGKTTLLNRLLADETMSNSAVVINEFGEIGLDHLIVAAPSENTVLLQNGCLCCSVQGELTATLADLYRRRIDGSLPQFDRILVETTGLADPMPILQSLLGDDAITSCYRMASVVTMVDAVNAEDQLSFAFEVLKQIATADRIIITKGDLVDEERLQALEARLAGINPQAVLMRANHGGANARDVLAETHQLHGAASMSSAGPSADAASRGDIEFRHGDVKTFSLEWTDCATMSGLHAWLHMLMSFKGPDLLRMKGIVNVDERPVLVNAVQSLIHDPIELPAWPPGGQRSRVVFITRGIERQGLERTLEALAYRPAEGKALDPRRYTQFVKLAQAFHGSLSPHDNAAGGER